MKLDDELAQRDVEASVGEGQRLGRAGPNLDAGVASPAGLDGGLGGIDRCDRCSGPSAATSAAVSAPGAAADVERATRPGSTPAASQRTRCASGSETSAHVASYACPRRGRCASPLPSRKLARTAHRSRRRAAALRRARRHDRLGRVKVLVVGSGGREHALAWKLAQSPSLTALHAAPGNPGIAGLGHCHPVTRRGRRGAARPRADRSGSTSRVGPEAPLVAGVADELRHNGIAVFGPSAGAARIEGSKTLREGRDAGGRRADGRRRSRSRGRRVWSRPTGSPAGKGVFVCRTQEELDAGLAAAVGLRRAARDRGAARGPGAVAVRALRRSGRRSRSRRRRTTSEPTTATRARTRAAWARTRRCPASARPPRRSSSSRCTCRCSRELAARGAPFSGPALRGADADRGRPAGARVQLPLRRPGDAVDRAPARGRPARGALRPRRGRPLRGSSSAGRRSAAVSVVIAAGDYPAAADRGSPIEGIEAAEAARCARLPRRHGAPGAGRSSRTAAGCSTSPAWRDRSPRRGPPPTRLRADLLRRRPLPRGHRRGPPLRAPPSASDADSRVPARPRGRRL